jgi:hypothetical protein
VVGRMSELPCLSLVQSDLSWKHLSPFSNRNKFLLGFLNGSFTFIKSSFLKKASTSIIWVIHEATLKIELGISQRSFSPFEFMLPMLRPIVLEPAHYLFDIRIDITK